MLALQNYSFCCIDYSFKYADTVKPQDYNKSDPVRVTIRGFCVDEQKIVKICYIREEFASFKLSKNDLVAALDLKPVIVSSGVISLDQNYQKKLDLNSLAFSGKHLVWDFK